MKMARLNQVIERHGKAKMIGKVGAVGNSKNYDRQQHRDGHRGDNEEVAKLEPARVRRCHDAISRDCRRREFVPRKKID